MAAAGIAGPLFVSVGQPEQLVKFLEINSPELTDAKALIDDTPDFAGYKQAGFNLLMDNEYLKSLESPPEFKPPKSMGPGRWFKYMQNVISLSPIPKNADGGFKLGDVPDGVKVLGGTYALDGDSITFAHSDSVPGATPDIEKVLASVNS